MLSSDLFVRAFGSARTGLLLLETATGRILEANPAFLRLCGRENGDIVGRVFWREPLVADAPAGAEVFEHLRGGGQAVGIELPVETAGGSCRLLELNGKQLTGDIVLLEVNDATERESARLAQRMDAQRALANRVAGEFAEMHQALQSPLPEAESIRAACDRAAGIVRELRAFGEQVPLEPCPVHLNGLIESMRPTLQRLLGLDIQIVFNLGPNVAPVMADAAQVRQIILKLAANSREAMEHGGTFRIATGEPSADDPALAPSSGNNAYAMLAVSDDGPGMDDESWAHLYEPFFTTKAHGKGLGLAAVHGIVRQSGGRLWVDSQPERGTSFRIYLPQAMAEGCGVPVEHADPRAATILLMEQNDGLRAVMTNILKKRGYRVLGARQAEEALDLARTQGAPDLLISEPESDLPQHLAGLQPRLRTLLLNGHTTRAGADTLIKPFEVETLLEKVRELLQ